jgi:hypothetical protein
MLRAPAISLPILLLFCACGPQDGRDPTTTMLVTASATIADTGGDPGSSGDATSDQDASDTAMPTSAADTSAGGTKLDVGAAETGTTCDPALDICCLEDGEVPPHVLLDAFLLVYPPANMPKSVVMIQAFAPQADGHMMAWSDENVGGEIVDAENGGVIAANIATGRDLARAAAEAAIPAGAVVIGMRDEVPIIEVLGGNGSCNGVGWSWGSILFEAVDLSIGELVYLYIGYCAEPDGDIEVFYYSDQAVQICAPPE